MTFAYDFDRLNSFLATVLKDNLKPEGWKWLENEAVSVRSKGDISRFNIAFVAMPRKTGKDIVNVSGQKQSEAQALRKGLKIAGWTNDRLARVWLLMQLNPADKEKYFATIENLFLSAEMGELVALYSSLPLLAYPELWRKRCAEGIRNNIGLVLESVICNNPYPSEQLDEAAWNQMVLKAIFTEKPMLEIAGLQERMNASLARALTDYAHERWAAQRPVNPLL
ncbi:MAG TPA: EboA domain-containing protein, partial [Chryseosolibacter sp.]